MLYFLALPKSPDGYDCNVITFSEVVKTKSGRQPSQQTVVVTFQKQKLPAPREPGQVNVLRRSNAEKCLLEAINVGELVLQTASTCSQ